MFYRGVFCYFPELLEAYIVLILPQIVVYDLILCTFLAFPYRCKVSTLVNY